MKEEILNFPAQFSYKPKVENAGKLKTRHEFIVAGMGGSHLAADLLKTWRPDLPLVIHSDYGLPDLPKEKLKKSLIIANSYSGNTEETLSAFQTALKAKLPLIAIGTGGKLIAGAKRNEIPFIQTPAARTEPRAAIGYNFVALLKAVSLSRDLNEAYSLEKSLHPEKLESIGRRMAKEVGEKTLIIYSSERNHALAYNWKINMNETAKSPAFTNVFPELNHNEMNAFAKKIKKGSADFYFLILKEKNEQARIEKRMAILHEILSQRNWPVKEISFGDSDKLQDIFHGVLLSMWTSYFVAESRGEDPDHTPIIEEFKKRMVA